MKLSQNTRKMLMDILICAVILILLLSGCARGGVYHRVTVGQTLYRISKAYDMDEIYLARVNGVSDPTQLQAGTLLYIPGADSVRKVADAPKPVKSKRSTAYSSKRQEKTLPKKVQPPKPVVVRKETPKKVVSKPKISKTTGDFRLLWPLKGEILRSFSAASKGGGRGLEIAAREQSDVKAAAAGKVIYSGDGVKGYGHLIILQHESDFYTVYGFNTRNLVAQGDFVSQGEKIAFSGSPPGGGKPRLHFEVRSKKVAVDPILYLP